MNSDWLRAVQLFGNTMTKNKIQRSFLAFHGTVTPDSHSVVLRARQFNDKRTASEAV